MGTINYSGIQIYSVGHGHWKCSYECYGRRLTRIITDSELVDKVKIGNKEAIRIMKYRIRVGSGANR